MKLFRPVNNAELKLIKVLNWKAFPPRLEGQPIFYPVLNEEYATEITVQWNVPSYGVGHVLSFEVKDSFLEPYKVEKVGLDYHLEFWIPSEDLEAMNSAIIGDIKLIASYS